MHMQKCCYGKSRTTRPTPSIIRYTIYDANGTIDGVAGYVITADVASDTVIDEAHNTRSYIDICRKRSVYDPNTCFRDTKLIIDSVRLDVRRHKRKLFK